MSSVRRRFCGGHRWLGDRSGPESNGLPSVWHVLEHLPRPLDTLRALAAALAPGGFCLVSVPRVDTLAVHGDLSYILQPRAHVVAYTEACLRGLMASCGLETVTALHELDDVFSKVEPLRLRLLARKGSPSVAGPSPSAALTPVLDAVAALLRAPMAGNSRRKNDCHS